MGNAPDKADQPAAGLRPRNLQTAARREVRHQVSELLRQLIAAQVPVTHEMLDELPHRSPVRQVRDLLISYEMLTERDAEYLHCSYPWLRDRLTILPAAGRDAPHHGHHGQEEASTLSFLHTRVQSRDRRAAPARRPFSRRPPSSTSSATSATWPSSMGESARPVTSSAITSTGHRATEALVSLSGSPGKAEYLPHEPGDRARGNPRPQAGPLSRLRSVVTRGAVAAPLPPAMVQRIHEVLLRRWFRAAAAAPPAGCPGS